MAWSRLLDGSALPTTTDSDWAAPNGTTQWSSASGVIQQRTNGSGAVQYFHHTTLSGTNMTFDGMLRVNSITGSGLLTDYMWGCWFLMDSGATDAWAFAFLPAQILQHANGGTPSTAYTVDMTTYRRVTVVKIGTTHQLWVDNILRYTKTGANATQGAGIWMGQASTGGGSMTVSADWQWMRYCAEARPPDVRDSTPDAAFTGNYSGGYGS